MTFIPHTQFKIGNMVRLKRPVSTSSGTFEKGTEMTIIDSGERWFLLKDSEKNSLLATGFSGSDFLELLQT